MTTNVQDNSLSRILSASDEAGPVFNPDNGPDILNVPRIETGGGRPLAYVRETVVDPAAEHAAQEQMSLVAQAAQPVVGKPAVDLGQPATGVAGAWYSVRNFFQYSVPGFFTSASNTVRGWFGVPTTVTTTNSLTGATSTKSADSNWMLWVFGLGLVAAIYYAVTKRKPGGKSFLPKLGKSSVKLR